MLTHTPPLLNEISRFARSYDIEILRRALAMYDWSILQYDLEWIHYVKSVMMPFIKKRHSIKNDNVITRDDVRQMPTIKVPLSFDSTTGGTTGNSLKYRIWTPAYEFIELREHYRQAAIEFEFEDSSSVCRLTNGHRNQKKLLKISIDEIPTHTLGTICSHGLKNPKMYRLEIRDMIEGLQAAREYMAESNFDIFLTSTSYITALAAVKGFRFCKLLSNICENADRNLFDSLKAQKRIDNWCDHMRCWDGGATFITCRYGTYHILDYLADVKEVDGALISTDYFSICTPFVNYDNGDLCSIGNEWKICRCGRFYREFNIIGRRTSFVLNNGATSIDLEDLIASLPGLQQLQIFDDHVVLVSTIDVDVKSIATAVGMPVILEGKFFQNRHKIPTLVNRMSDHQQIEL